MSTSEKKRIRVVSGEIIRDGRYLITQRASHAVLPFLWEFPGGRVRSDESDQQALERLLELRLGAQAEVGEKVLEVEHDYEAYGLVLAVYSCDVGHQKLQLGNIGGLAWASPEELASYTFPGADQETIEALLKDD